MITEGLTVLCDFTVLVDFKIPQEKTEEGPGAEVKSQVQGLVIPAPVWDLYWCIRGSYWGWRCEK